MIRIVNVGLRGHSKNFLSLNLARLCSRRQRQRQTERGHLLCFCLLVALLRGMASCTRLLSKAHQCHDHPPHHVRFPHAFTLPSLQPHHEPLQLRSKVKGDIHHRQHISNVLRRCSTPKPHRKNTIVAIRAQHTSLFTSPPLVSPSNHWGTWSILLSIAAFGIWSEKSTDWGRRISGALTSTLVGLLFSNIGVIASDAPAYSIVNQYLLPLSVPLLLFSADLRVVIASTGRLLVAFCLGSVATVLGTFAAWKIIPLHSLGSDGWKIAAALMSRHIGGAINYVAVSEALGVSSSAVAAGLAADNLICAVYFTTLFALAAKIPKESLTQSEEGNAIEKAETGNEGGPRAYLLQNACALALSSVICTAGVYLAKILGFQGGNIPCITVLVVFLATLCPSLVGPLAPAGEAFAILLIQVFFVVVGANASIWNVVETAPYLFVFCFVQIAIHLLIILGVGKLLGFEERLLLLASNANVGGPTTAAGLATAKGWKSLIVPGILAGIFGVAIATFISIFLGIAVLKHM